MNAESTGSNKSVAGQSRRETRRQRGGGRHRRWGWILSVATVVIVAAVGSLHLFRELLSDNLLAFDFALANFVTAGLFSFLFLAWAAWLWAAHAGFLVSRLIPLLGVLGMVAGSVLFRPVFQGAMGINRWEPRFWTARRVPTEDGDQGQAITIHAEDKFAFPQFLGPDRNGVVATFHGDLSRLAEAELVWKTPVGEGWSGFVCSSGYGFTAWQVGSDEAVVCLDLKDGSVVWEFRQPRRQDDPLGGVGPRSTPTLSGDMVFFAGANGLVSGIDARSGDLIWQQDLVELLQIPIDIGTTTQGHTYQQEKSNVAWGRAGSPLVVDDVVVVPGGGPPGGPHVSLIAFDRNTGDERWRLGTEPIGYASPLVMELMGKRQIIVADEGSYSGYDADTRELLWRYMQPGHSDSDANTSQPVRVDQQHLLLTKGYGMGGKLIALPAAPDNSGARGVTATPELVWHNQRVLKTKLTSAVIHEGFAYALSDGILECVEVASGKRQWKRGRFGHGQLLLINDRLLIHGEQGGLTVVMADPQKYDERAQIATISGVCWNTIAVYDRLILVRSDIAAACFRLPPGKKRQDAASGGGL